MIHTNAFHYLFFPFLWIIPFDVVLLSIYAVFTFGRSKLLADLLSHLKLP